MSNEAQNTLKEQLALKQRELDMVLAVDHIRDTAVNLSAMLTAIAQVLADHLHSDLCLIVLLDKESNQVELKALFERGQQNGLAQLISAQLAEEAVSLNEITLWDKAAIDGQVDKLPEQLQLAVTPIIMGDDERLGRSDRQPARSLETRGVGNACTDDWIKRSYRYRVAKVPGWRWSRRSEPGSPPSLWSR